MKPSEIIKDVVGICQPNCQSFAKSSGILQRKVFSPAKVGEPEGTGVKELPCTEIAKAEFIFGIFLGMAQDCHAQKCEAQEGYFHVNLILQNGSIRFCRLD